MNPNPIKPRHTIVWHRCDLRLDDNLTLTNAISLGLPICAVYILDPFWHGTGRLGLERSSGRRLGVLLETLSALAKQYRDIGHGLIVRIGDTVTELSRIAKEVNASHLYYSRGKTTYEQRVEDRLCSRLGKTLSLVGTWNDVLLDPGVIKNDTKIRLKSFTQFRKSIEPILTPVAPKTAPTSLNPNPLPVPPIPRAKDLGYEPVSIHSDSPIAGLEFGAVGAFKQLNRYLWQTESVAHYKDTRNGMLNWSDSSRVSIYLALGSISPGRLIHEIQCFESQRTKNQSTYWLQFELLWREYFHHLAFQVGSKLFQLEGTQGNMKQWKGRGPAFESWCQGETGIPFIDAHMVELLETGYMSNRGRQIVASYLSKDLQVDWRLGAAWFESQLIDYDPCVNWGNWQYQAGVGVDVKDRRFNVLLQAKRYDAENEYVRRWLTARYMNMDDKAVMDLNDPHRPDS